jgi:hypothetical protein
MSRPRAADDFAAIRARMDELRREREAATAAPDGRGGKPPGRESDIERRRRRERMEGTPPPWVPTIFVRRQRG